MRSASPTSDTPAKDSPAKRKRSISDPTIYDFAPHLRTDFVGAPIYSDAELAGARSPRTIVAEKLSELRLQGTLSAIHFGDPAADGHGSEKGQSYKKVKFAFLREGSAIAEGEEEEEDGHAQGHSDAGALQQQRRHRRLKSPPPPNHEDLEIQETPEHTRVSTPSLSPPYHPPSTPEPSIPSAEGIPMERSNSLPIISSSTKIVTAIPPPSPQLEQAIPSPKKPPKRNIENTDIEVDDSALDPDDDGTGINGIGFKPTPAMAWARTQKRKQQIADWRARETREARQKRSERRNRAAAAVAAAAESGMMGGAGAMRRTVRFAQ